VEVGGGVVGGAAAAVAVEEPEVRAAGVAVDACSRSSSSSREG
jgi:hypothetical protein